MVRFRYFWEELNASFWFIPILILLFSIVAAVGMVYLDNLIDFSPTGVLEYIFSGSVESAREILTLIGAAMIGIAGTVFSITLVVLTLASSQLGARLLRNFMYDKLNQVVLGTYVSTFIYCLIVLFSIHQNEDIYFVPVFATYFAMLAAIAGIVLLIVFIHHVSVSIHANKVIADISDSMLKNMNNLFPDELGYESNREEPDIESLKNKAAFQKEVLFPRRGYLQSVDSDLLMKISVQEDLKALLYFKPGDYIVKGQVLMVILSDKQIGENIPARMLKAFIGGKVRTPVQDAEFSIVQISEIASRALSPGINDPHTALSCIHGLTSIMCRLTSANFPSPYRYDEEGRLRIISVILTFAGLLDASFSQIRHYAGGNPSILMGLMDAMITINGYVTNDKQRSDLIAYARMIMSTSMKTISEQDELSAIQEKFDFLLKYAE